MPTRIPNTESPAEVRRAFQRMTAASDLLLDGASGEILIGVGAGLAPIWSTVLTLTSLTVDNITIDGAGITSDTGTISFGDDNTTTTGAIAGVNVTSGESPGHLHDNRYYTETELDAGQLDNRYYTETEIDALFEAAVDSYTAETDSNVVAGQPVYTKATTHVDLADAIDVVKCHVSGLTIEAASSGESVEYTADGKVELGDWTDIIGSATLTAGVIYYLAESSSGYPATSYANAGGIGDRTSWVTVTSTMSIRGGTPPVLVNGTYGSELRWWSQAVAGLYTRFDFSTGGPYKINEAKWYTAFNLGHGDQGIWKWQGSNDASAWTDIGSSFLMTGFAIQTMTELSANATGYRYYQLLGVSGNNDGIDLFQEVEFKISEFVLGAAGMLTTAPPTTAGSYVVQVGRAISTTTLDVEIGPIILL